MLGPGGVRNGMNDPEKCRRNCGAEGPDKGVIVKKRQSIGFYQSLAEAWNSATS